MNSFIKIDLVYPIYIKFLYIIEKVN